MRMFSFYRMFLLLALLFLVQFNMACSSLGPKQRAYVEPHNLSDILVPGQTHAKVKEEAWSTLQ